LVRKKSETTNDIKLTGVTNLRDKPLPRPHWTGETPDPKKYLGFLYLITNKITGRKYIGRKQYWLTRKGKRLKESDWRTYTGSSPTLNRDIKNQGIGNFEFKIVAQFESKGALRYVEANVMHKKDILLDPDNWYNRRIEGTYNPGVKDFDELRKVIKI
jgi:hypothetical protein